MSWRLERKDEGWYVIRESDDSTAGVHLYRADAIKHQRALYANESRVASMYAELDALPDPEPEPEPVVAAAPSLSPVTAEIMALLLREENDRSLVASVAESQSLLSQQFQEAQQERQALVAALGRMGSPTINLPPAEVNVTVPPAEVNFTAPAPEVNVHVPPAEVTVNSPDVNVTIEAAAPTQKTVTINRDPLTRMIESATVEEQ